MSLSLSAQAVSVTDEHPHPPSSDVSRAPFQMRVPHPCGFFARVGCGAADMIPLHSPQSPLAHGFVVPALWRVAHAF
jgi:hypothetical protein